MNDHDTAVLTSRLRQLADELSPPLDVVAQVRDARAGHHRRRRTRIALLAVATATAVALVGIPLTIGSPNSAPSGEVAGPGRTTTAPATTDPGDAAQRAVEEALRRAQQAAQQAAQQSSGQPAPGIPTGWEPRSFLGVDFAVPPGARMDDYVAENPPAESDGGPTFIWNGFSIGGGEFAHVKVQVWARPAHFPAPGGSERVTVRGADEAFASVGVAQYASPNDPSYHVEATDLTLEILAAHRQIHVEAAFPAGPAGEQMVRDLIASLVVG